jgi:hypothetical protein
MKLLIIKILRLIYNNLGDLLSKLSETKDQSRIKIQKEYHEKLKCYKVKIINSAHLETHEFIEEYYPIIMSDSEIVKYAPDKKIILATGR